MTKPLLLSVLVTFFLLNLGPTSAQKKLSKFGHVDKKEMETLAPDFDPDAALLCLFEESQIQYNLGSHEPILETYIRKRFKVLKPEGVGAASVKLRYYNKDNFEFINRIDGFVYNMEPDGSISSTKMRGNETYRKKLDGEYSEVSFALPGVKQGSIFEYKYVVYRKTISQIAPWYFQHDYPTLYSICNAVIPEYFDFNYSAVRRQPLDIQEFKNTHGTYFAMENIKSLHDEPYMAGVNDFLQRVNFQLSTIHPPGQGPITVGKSWEDLSKILEGHPQFGQQLNKNIKGTDALELALKSATNDLEKLSIIYRFVQQNMSWDHSYGLFTADEGLKAVWDKKQGSIADINMILVDLLRDYDIKAFPILVSTRDHGSVNMSSPDLMEFNATMAIARIDSTQYILNAADKFNPAYLIPYDVQYTRGYLVDSKQRGWVDIFDGDKKEKTSITVTLTLDKDGTFSGNGRAIYYDYAKNIHLAAYQKKELKDRLNLFGDITLNIDTLIVNNTEDTNKPLDVEIGYNGHAQKSGKYTLIPYDLFLGMKDNPFKEEERQTSINFGHLQDLQVTGYINLPEGMTIESAPKSATMRLSDSSIIFKRLFQMQSEHMLAFQLKIEHLRPEYTVLDYPEIKAYYKKMFELLAEKVVLKEM